MIQFRPYTRSIRRREFSKMEGEGTTNGGKEEKGMGETQDAAWSCSDVRCVANTSSHNTQRHGANCYLYVFFLPFLYRRIPKGSSLIGPFDNNTFPGSMPVSKERYAYLDTNCCILYQNVFSIILYGHFYNYNYYSAMARGLCCESCGTLIVKEITKCTLCNKVRTAFRHQFDFIVNT